MTFTIDDQIKEVAREIAMRRNVYPKFVASGRLKQEASDRQIACMEAVIETLKTVKEMAAPDANILAGGCPQCGHRHPPDGMCVT